MKCPNCGAEIGPNAKFCESCGSQVSLEMRREQEQLNKAGCPKCGSTNIRFTRENQGEISGKNSRKKILKTVGICNDCGHTWYTDVSDTTPEKNNLVWWVLGWIFFFPAPVMVLIWRKKNTWDVKTKIIVTVIFWVLIFVIGSLGDKDDKTKSETTSTTAATVEEKKEETVAKTEEQPVQENATVEEIADEPVVDERAELKRQWRENDMLDKSPEEFYDDIPHDRIGKWRVCVINSERAAVDYLADYYNAYFANDKEMHFIINKAADTTTSAYVKDGKLITTVRRHREGEEKDAKLLNTAEILDEFEFDLETGELVRKSEKEPKQMETADKSEEKKSEYEMAYAKVFPDYTIFYLFDVDKKICIYYLSSDGYGYYGKYTGDLSKSITITRPIQGYPSDYYETMRFTDGYGSKAIVTIADDPYEVEFVNTSVDYAEKFLKSIQKE